MMTPSFGREDSAKQAVISILYPLSSVFSDTLRALAQLSERFEGVDARIVAIAPGDFIGVVPDRSHGRRRQRHQFAGFQNTERIRGLKPFFAATGARAVFPQVLPGIFAAVT